MKVVLVVAACLLSGCSRSAPHGMPNNALVGSLRQVQPLAPTRTPVAALPPVWAGPLCEPTALTLVWEQTASGLSGTLTERNISSAACAVGQEPLFEPLDRQGRPLPVEEIVTTSLVLGGPPLLPGHTATAGLSWPSWCGSTPASGQVRVDRAVVVTASGPAQPSCRSGPQNSSAGQFTVH